MHKPILSSFTIVGSHIWCDTPQVHLWMIFSINNNDFHHPDMCRSCLFEALKIAVRDAVSSNSYLEMNCYRYVGTFFRGGLLDWTWAELLAGAPGEVLDCAGGAVLGRGEAQVFNISTFIDFLIVSTVTCKVVLTGAGRSRRRVAGRWRTSSARTCRRSTARSSMLGWQEENVMTRSSLD